MSSKDSKYYIGGDPLPRPDITDRGERGTPLGKPKATTHKATHKAAPKRTQPAQTAKAAPDPKPKAPSYRAPDNYSTYGRPGTNDMGPSGSWSKPKTVSLGKLPADPTPKPKSTPSGSAKPKATTPTPYIGGDPLTKSLPDYDPGLPEETGIVPIPPASTKQSKHSYKVRWS